MTLALEYSPEVAAAKAQSLPLVALESTLISHGMPYPQNLQTAQRLEQTVRDGGAVPATVALMDGYIKVGLDATELERLARDGQQAHKCSRRDLALVLAAGTLGATTVAATMIIARLAGIEVFATGGIGGVHRGGADSLDISADLQELAQTPVTVVCAGPKAILDIPLTLEYLETHGVAMVSYGQDALPAFYCRDSGLKAPFRLDSPAQIAAAMVQQRALGLGAGMVVNNPVPAAHGLDRDAMEQAIQQALAAMAEAGVQGKQQTPFLLAEVARLTGGDSLAANIELVCHNASLAAAIACAYQESHHACQPRAIMRANKEHRHDPCPD